MKAVDAATMRALDGRAVEEAGVPGVELMERAGSGAAAAIAAFASKLPPSSVRRVVVLAGKGNNGGDAYVVARLLPALLPGVSLSLHSACQPSALSDAAAEMFRRIPEDLKRGMKLSLAKDDFKEGDLIVDGLLGTGVSGPLREPFKEWIELVNASGLPVVSLDIPSGLDANDGSVSSCAVEADLTATMALPKAGMLLGEGPRLCGRLALVDIGIPRRFVDEAPSSVEATFSADIRPLLGREPFDSHKNSRGSVLVIGGSSFYPGAPFLSALSALKAGSGLVFAAVPKGIATSSSYPHALIVRGVPGSSEGFFSRDSVPVLEELMKKAGALAIGPGLSQEPSCVAALTAALSSGLPLVVDADALNLIAKSPSLISRLNGPCVMTPHPGEMKRLAEGFGLPLLEDRMAMASSFAKKSGCVVVLKGCRSVVASPDGRTSVNCSGCAALATAGSGDVLSGLVASLLAKGLEPYSAARAAVFIHGLAGELACPCGSRGLIADELPALIPAAMKEISPLS